ncbi:MAG TPA: DNA-deoxyinosine glycosylase [Spongiibacteraceae bacterium]|nr:DNA-deoxyinosine glycosylase [Spongiibacteraceae bacterium]
MTILQSFAPICGDAPRVLILGTMPGKMSLAQQQYYAHPQNAFWRILGELLHFDAKSDYAARVESIKKAHIALWDVLKFCVRESSLDADIKAETEVPNDIVQLLKTHDTIRRVCFNGGKAAQLFRRHVAPQLPDNFRDIEYCPLPSTSPAHAGMRYAQKLDAWRIILK